MTVRLGCSLLRTVKYSNNLLYSTNVREVYLLYAKYVHQ